MSSPISTPQPPDAESADAEARFQEQVWGNLRRNYIAHLLHGMLGQTGFRMFQTPTFLPAYVDQLAGANGFLWVSVVRALQGFGQCITPLVSATFVEHRRRVLPLGFAIGSAMRLQFLGIALAGFFLPPLWNLIAICVFMSLFGLLLGMQGVIFNTLMSKVIPVERRGVLTGTRNALAGVVVFFVGGLGGAYLVEPNAFGNGYAAVFGVAFLLTAAGLAMLLFTREPEAPAVRRPAGLRERLGDVPALLRGDPDFTRYFAARTLTTIGRGAVPFYILFAKAHGTVTGVQLGVLTGAFALAQSVSNLGWGLIADRGGYRVVYLLAVTLWVGSVAVLLGRPGFVGLMGVYIGIGAGMGGFQMSSMNLVLEFGLREDVPLRIGLANTASELAGAFATLGAGLVAQFAGFSWLFALAVAFKLASVGLMWTVHEPRFRLDGDAVTPD